MGAPATPAEVVRAAYRSLIQRSHPDRNPGDDAAGARAVAITQAYEVLCDAESRGAYDRHLLTEPARRRGEAAPMAPRMPRPTPPGGGRASRAQMPWWWAAVGLAVIAGAVWLGKNEDDPRAELAAVRRAFATADAPQARRQQLVARKEELLQRYPELRLEGAAETARERAARTIEWVDSPLVVQSTKYELVIPRLRLVLGGFDAPVLRRHIEDQRERLVQAVAQRLAADSRLELAPVADPSYLREVIASTLNNALGIRLDDSYPSTYFESPGRYGVVDVVMLDRFELRLR